MCNFKITNVITGRYKIFVEVQNEETEEREYITLPAFYFSTTEENIIKETIEKKCPNDLTFEVESVNSHNLYKAVCNTLDEYIENLR